MEYELNGIVNVWTCTIYTMEQFIKNIKKQGAINIKKIPHKIIKK